MTLFSQKLVWQLFFGGSGVGMQETLITYLFYFHFCFCCLIPVGCSCLCGFYAVEEPWAAVSHSSQRLLNQQLPSCSGEWRQPRRLWLCHSSRQEQSGALVGMMSSGLLQHDVKVQAHVCISLISLLKSHVHRSTWI